MNYAFEHIFFHIFTIVGLTFVAIPKKHDLPVRAHVNFPSTNRYTLDPVVRFPSTLIQKIRHCLGYNSAISIVV